MKKQLIKSGKRICYQCKNIYKLDRNNFYYNRSYGQGGFSYLCIQCNKKPPKITVKYKYREYKKRAVKNSISFSISLEYFSFFWKKDCHYCGCPIKTIGIDRKESNIGYVNDNCVSCCSDCNYMKNSRSYNDFIEKCRIISNRIFPRCV